jgi:hypothetical protein
MAVPHELILIPTPQDEIDQLVLDLESIDLPVQDKNAEDAQEYKEIVSELQRLNAKIETLKGIPEPPSDVDLPPVPEIGEIMSVYGVVDEFIERGVQSTPGGGLKIGGEVIPEVKFKDFVRYSVDNRDQLPSKHPLARKKLRELYPERDFPGSKTVCVECGRKFSRPRDLRRHQKNVHREKDNTHQCLVCLMTFARKDHVLRHTRVMH